MKEQTSYKHFVAQLFAPRVINERVALLETQDPEKIIEVTSVTFREKDVKYVYLFDLRNNVVMYRTANAKLLDWKRDNVNISGPNLFKEIKARLTSGSNLVIVLLPELHETQKTGAFMNFVSGLLIDPAVRASKSYLVMVASDLSLYFTSKFLENVYTVRPSVPNYEERVALLRKWLGTFYASQRVKMVYPWLMDDDFIKNLAIATGGLDARQIKLTVKVGIAEMVTKGNEGSAETMLEYVKKARTELLSSTYNVEMVEPRVDFSYVGGYDYVKDALRLKIRHLKLGPVLRKYSIEPPKGVLLFGPPGTGKTHLTEAVAGELGWPMVMVDFANFASKWYGESEKRLKELLHVLDKIGKVVAVFDEVEQLFVQREGQAHEVSVRLVSILNTWLAKRDREVFVIATANYPEKLDPAAIRAGRFDEKIPVMYPDPDARKQIFDIHMHKYRKLVFDGDMEELVDMTHMFSGAEIESLIVKAIEVAMSKMSDDEIGSFKDGFPVTIDDFKEARKEFRINESKRLKEIETYLEKARMFGTSESIISELERTFIKPKGEVDMIDI